MTTPLIVATPSVPTAQQPAPPATVQPAPENQLAPPSGPAAASPAKTEAKPAAAAKLVEDAKPTDLEAARNAAIANLERERVQMVVDRIGKPATSYVLDLVRDSSAAVADDGVPADVRASYAEADALAEPDPVADKPRKAA